MKLVDKNDFLPIVLLFTPIFQTTNKEFTIIKNIPIQEILIGTIILYIAIILILLIFKLIKEQSILSFLFFLGFSYLMASNFYGEIHHYFTSKEIELDAKVIKTKQLEINEKYKNGETFYDKIIIETSNNLLNNKDIYNANYKIYDFLEKGDNIIIKGRISMYIFKADKFIFKDKKKQLYYGKYTKYD